MNGGAAGKILIEREFRRACLWSVKKCKQFILSSIDRKAPPTALSFDLSFPYTATSMMLNSLCNHDLSPGKRNDKNMYHFSPLKEK